MNANLLPIWEIGVGHISDQVLQYFRILIRDKLLTFWRDIRNRGHADSLELRLTDDVTLHENSMILQRLRVEVPAEIAEVGEPILTKTKRSRLRSFNFFAARGIGHGPAHRTGGMSQHP